MTGTHADSGDGHDGRDGHKGNDGRDGGRRLRADMTATLARETAKPYRRVGLFAWRFAVNKMSRDPAYIGILERGLIPDSGRLLDLGCGQGLMAAWLLTARARYEAGNWPAQWPAPPRVGSVAGIELMPGDVARARAALAALGPLGANAGFVAGDLRAADFGKADAAIILDVLHYMDRAAQDAVLLRVRDALAPSGTLLIRVGDAAGGWRFRCSRWVDWTVTFARGHRLSALHCRPLSEWRAALAALGFAVDAIPMSAGTPFANVLLVARLGQRTEPASGAAAQ